MITFKQFLKENAKKIPALNGGREIYATEAFIYHNELNAAILRSTIKPLERVYDDLDLIYGWDFNYGGRVMYTGDNFDQARASLVECMEVQEKLNNATIINRILEQVDILKEVVGTFKVISLDAPSYEYITFGIEVNLDAYNAASHSQEDLLGF
jgi:hypothetical protein